MRLQNLPKQNNYKRACPYGFLTYYVPVHVIAYILTLFTTILS